MKDKNLLVINETHFNVQTKCPKNFTLIKRSIPVKSLKPRGGVALYKNSQVHFDILPINHDFGDSVIAKICNTNIVIIAVYIPPSNTQYYKDESFHNISVILEM